MLDNITAEEALHNIKRHSKPYAELARQGKVVAALPKATPVLRAGLGGAGGAILTDMLFPQKAGDFNDIAAITQYTTDKTQNLMAPSHTPGAMVVPSWASPENLSRFSNGKTATPQNALSMYGKVPGTAIIRDTNTNKVLAKGIGEATGGFAPVTDREAEVARVAEREASGRAQALEDVAYLDRKKAENEALNQRLQATANIGWAMDNPSAPGARAIIANYQQYNKENLAKEQRAPQQSLGQEIAGIRESVGRSSALPFDIAGKKAQADLYSAQAEAHRAQTQALPQQNALKAATAIAQAKAKLSENNSKLWSDMIATGNESAILALGTRPEFREMVAAYRAAQQLASEG